MIKKLRSPLFILLAQFAASLQTQKIEKNSNSSTDFPFEFGDLLGAFRFGFTVRKTLFFVVLLFSFIVANSQTITSAGSGNWNTPATWVGGVVPSAANNVTIVAGHAVTVTTAASITNLNLSTATSKLNINSSQVLTVAGTFLNSGTTSNGVNGPGTILFTGTATFGNLTPTGNRPNIIIGNGISANTVTVGANTLINDVTVNTGATLSTGARAISVNGNFNNSGTITGTSSVVTLLGNFTNNGNVSLTSGQVNLTSGDFTNASTGIFTLTTTGRITMTIGNFSNLGTVTYSANGRLYLGGNYSNSGAFTLTNGGLVYFTGAANQTIQGYTTTGTTSMFKTGGTVTFTGNVNGASLTLNGTSGTLNLGASGLTHTFTGNITRTAGTLNCGSSYLKVGGSFSGTVAVFIGGTGTVEYYRVGTQTAAVGEYNNLIISGTSNKTFPTTPTVNGTLTLGGTTAGIVVTTGVVTYGVNASLKYSKGTAYVATLEEWVTPFAATGGVVIDNIGTVSITSARSFNNGIPLTVNSNGNLALTTSLLTLNGDLGNNGTVSGTTGGVTIAGTVPQNIGAFSTTGTIAMTKTAGTAIFTGPVSGGALTINGTGGTLNLGAGFTHVLSGTVTLSNGILNGGSSRLNVNATSSTAWNGTGTNFMAGTGTVNFGGVAQTLATASTFYNLIFSNSGLKTLTGVPTIIGILSMEDIATVNTMPIYGTIAKLQYNRTSPLAAGSEWVSPFEATGGVTVLNTGIITSNGNKIFSSSVPLTVDNSVGGGLSTGGFALSGAGILTVDDGATLFVSGTGAFPSGFATNNLTLASTVDYNGGAQSIAAQNYGNLSLSGSGNKTFTGATTVADELAIGISATAFLLNGTTSTVQTLTFGGVTQASTSWGGTASFATNSDAARFGTSTTGIINVAIACTPGTWLGTISNNWNTAGNWCGGTIPIASTNVIISAASNQPNIGTTGGVCRNLSIASGATLTILGSSTLTISGNWINNGTLTSGGTTTFNGSIAQNIGGTGINVFNNLTNSKSTTPLNALAGITINGILNNSTVNSVLDMSNFALIGGVSFSNAGLGQIRTANASATPIPSGKTWANSVLYTSLTGGQTVVGGTYSSTLALNNTSGTQTASGNIAVGNQFNIVTGGNSRFSMNGFNLSVGSLNIATQNAVLDMIGGALTHSILVNMNGTIRFSGAANGKAFSSGTVEYYGAGQTVAAGSYNNLLFSGVAGSYSVTNDLDINNTLTVSNGAVTVQGGVSVSVDNAVTVTTPGTLTLENNASLIQTTYTGVNTGTIMVKRNTTPIINDDFTYWSSPTSGSQTLYDFSPNTQSDKFFDYNNDWANVNQSTTVFTPGIGYAIRSPEGTNATVPTATSFQFVGVPNNGTITVPLTVRSSDNLGERLVGNPYPSALDADAFIAANILGTANPGTINQTITGTLYFWTHNHTLSGNDYVASDYATYNLSGGSGVDTGTGNVIDPTQYIASGQGFFIETDAAGNLTFNNSMRDNIDNTNFYRTKAKKEVEERHRIYLRMTNNTVNSSQTTVAYVTNATNEFENGYDSYVYDDAQPYAMYSLIGTSKMVIQGRAVPFVDTDVVPLGYAINQAGPATIAVYNYDGLFLEEQGIFLEDKVLNVIHNLKEDPYNFISAVGTFDDRFVLRYTDKTLSTDDFGILERQIVISKDKNELKIKSELETIKKIMVFDILGRKIIDNPAVNSNEFRTSNSALKNQIGIVKVTLTNGQVLSKKVVF
ncbi:T9SS sorting signal type C domain-containing protein [Flavobacterium xanthum]|nr:T9SS sorting signal type C domain-containing protein [Flavobacterium xanthum]